MIVVSFQAQFGGREECVGDIDSVSNSSNQPARVLFVLRESYHSIADLSNSG